MSAEALYNRDMMVVEEASRRNIRTWIVYEDSSTDTILPQQGSFDAAL